MAARRKIADERPMASRWRRQTTCVLIVDRPMPVTLRAVSAACADVATTARPSLGRAVELHHPEAGMIRAMVSGHDLEGVRLSFDRSSGAVAFALAVITADMSRAG
jgi:hypothetical protein